MSETYVVAARLRLKKKAVTAWLRSAWPDAKSLRWPKKPALAFGGEAPRSVRHGLAATADQVAESELGGLVAAWDGAARSFLLYHVMIGFQPDAAARSLLAIAAAAPHWTLKKPTHALFFAETGARLCSEGVMAAVEIGVGGARFVSAEPVAPAAVKDLAPAEARWDEALDMGLLDAMHDPAMLQAQIRQVAQYPPLKKRKREVSTFTTAKEWLAAIAAVRVVAHGEKAKKSTEYANWGQFERDIMAYAGQARRFGVKVKPKLKAMLTRSAWEPGVIAFWALNQLSQETNEPTHYLEAITLWRTWSEAHLGWARGEVTGKEEAGATADHKAALAGTRFARRGILALARSKDELVP